jgi:type II secretory pathway pseudopilin PulG
MAGTRYYRQERSRNRGFQLYELLVVLTILSLSATAGIPRVLEWTRHLKVDSAAHELVGVLRLARSYAVRYGTRVGVKFRPDSKLGVTFTIYRDGDGDGVRTADIVSGDDPPIGPPRQLGHFGSYVRFGFPPGPAPRDPGNPSSRLDRLDDPIRFNRSDIASFDHLGTSTPGSLYLTDGRALLSVVRLFGRTGKVKILRYDAKTERWEKR